MDTVYKRYVVVGAIGDWVHLSSLLMSIGLQLGALYTV
jgi:hypothetical protein